MEQPRQQAAPARPSNGRRSPPRPWTRSAWHRTAVSTRRVVDRRRRAPSPHVRPVLVGQPPLSAHESIRLGLIPAASMSH
jgi:hypothetical protein